MVLKAPDKVKRNWTKGRNLPPALLVGSQRPENVFFFTQKAQKVTAFCLFRFL